MTKIWFSFFMSPYTGYLKINLDKRYQTKGRSNSQKKEKQLIISQKVSYCCHCTSTLSHLLLYCAPFDWLKLRVCLLVCISPCYLSEKAQKGVKMKNKRRLTIRVCLHIYLPIWLLVTESVSLSTVCRRHFELIYICQTPSTHTSH